jgi:hypothetical protein
MRLLTRRAFANNINFRAANAFRQHSISSTSKNGSTSDPDAFLNHGEVAAPAVPVPFFSALWRFLFSPSLLLPFVAVLLIVLLGSSSHHPLPAF